MKIGVDLRTLAQEEKTGVPQYIKNLFGAILKIDKENEYCFFLSGLKEVSLDFLKQNNSKIIKLKIPNKIFNQLILLFNWPKIDKLIGGCDIFFSPHFLYSPLSNKTKKILVIHDLSFLYLNSFYTFRQKLWHKRMMISRQIKGAQRIIAISKSTKNDILKFFGKELDNKIKVIYHGVNHSFFKKLDLKNKELKNFKKIHSLPQSYILYLGPLNWRKNITSLIEAFIILKRNYKNLNLLICGSKEIPGALEFPCPKGVYIYPNIKDEERPFFYSLAKIFIYPSYFEGFGLPLIEAMSSKLPIITAKNSSIPEVVGDSAIFIDPYNISEIIRGATLLLKNPSLADYLSKKAFLRSKKFSWAKSAKKTLKIFKEL